MTRADASHLTFSQRLRRSLLRGFLWLAFTSLLTVAALAYLVLEQTPLLADPPPLGSHDAKVTADFIKRISRKVIDTHDPITIRAGADEINSTLHVAHRTYSGFVGTTSLTSQGAEFKLTVRTHILGKRYYLNGQATLKNSPEGFDWSKSRIGNLPLSDGMANFLFYRLVEAALGKVYGRKVLAGISDIDVSTSQIHLVFQPPHGFQEGIARVVERLNSYAGQDIKFDSTRVQHYLDVLVDYTRSQPAQKVSLTEYLSLLLDESWQQRELGFSPSTENLSALYALGLQVGPGVFRHFVADIQLHRLNATRQPRLTLMGREDLAKHFVYSAALKILSEKGFSFSIGEIKEVLDANGDGSGFSFIDITADKVGIRFAELAIGSEKTALAVQESGREGIREDSLFPDVSALPEGLSEQEFKRNFSDLESDSYQSLLNEIDVRIDQMPFFSTFVSSGEK